MSAAPANVALAARVRGALDLTRLHRAADALAQRHDALTAPIENTVAGAPVASSPRALGELRVRRVDEDALPDATAEEAGRPFDLSSPPLARASLLRLAASDHVVVLTAAREVVDEASLSVLADELGRLYAGEALPPARGRARPRALAAAGGDALGPGVTARASRALPPRLARSVRDFARERQTTPRVVYAAAFATAVAAVTGHDNLNLRLPPPARPCAIQIPPGPGPALAEIVARVRGAAAAVRGEAAIGPVTALVELRPLLRLPGLACEPVPFAGGGLDRSPVSLELEERGHGIRATLEHTAAGPGAIDAMAVLKLLEATLAAGVSGVATGHRPAPPPADSRCLDELFAEQVARTPLAVAVSDGASSLTYRQLDARAAALARRLRKLGVDAETPVGICLERSADLVVATLAVLAAGGAYVPLDPAYPALRLKTTVDDARCRVVVCDPRSAARLPAGCVRVVPDAGEAAGRLTPARMPPDSAAYIVYTSGSTGRPKGVVVTHANVTRLFQVTHGEFGFGAGDVWTLFHSHAFDFSVWELWGALLHGGRLVVVPYLTSRSPLAFLELLQQERVTILNQTPSAFRELARAATDAGYPPTSLRLVVFGGEVLDPRLLRAWLAAYGDQCPRLVNMYGITETTVHVTARRVEAADAEHGGSPIGMPLADLSLTLRDGNLEPVPQGEPGELVIAGAGVARGYLNLPRETAERFVPDPDGLPGTRAYRSGDIGVLRRGGELHYLGRADTQVKLRGHRIELREIEVALADEPSVAGAVAMLRDRPEGGQRLVAYVVPGRGGTLDPGRLRAHLAGRLPSYMLPAAFVTLEKLPLTANGKLDRAALPEVGAGRQGEVAAPQTDAEHTLAEAWAQVLGLERTGPDDSFFQLGGDSILALRVVAEAAERGLSVEFEDIFATVTLRELAARGRWEEAGAEERVGRETQPNAFPLSQMQVGLVYDTVTTESRLVYQDLLAADVEGAFDEAGLRHALGALAQRHELLRVSFDLIRAGDPLQRADPGATVPLEVLDLRGRPREEQARAVARMEARALAAPFEWAKAPLLRCCAAVRGETDFRLSLIVSHAIVDGWSFSRLATDLLLLYARALGDDVALPPLPASGFRHFVAAERAARTPEAAAYWEAVLDGADPPPTLSRAGSDGPERLSFPVPPQAVAELQRLSGPAGLPLKSMFLALHATALAEAAGRREAVTGIVVNGRPEVPGGDLLVGLYLNSVPVRLAPARDLVETARAAFAAETDLLPHRRYPHADLRRRLGRAPFDVLFNYTHFHVYTELARLETLRVRRWSYQDRPHFPFTAEYVVRELPDDVRVTLTRWPTEVSAAAASSFAAALRRLVSDLA